MRQATFALIISIILIISSFPAQAGKPTPYPAPGVEMQGEAYPPPAPAPGLDFPDDFCETDILCAWGPLEGGIWIATFRGAGSPYPELQVLTCIRQQGSWWSYCDEMRWRGYMPADDLNIYTLGPIPGGCSPYPFTWKFYIVYVWTEITGNGAIRQPNEYVIHCVMLTYIVRPPQGAAR